MGLLWVLFLAPVFGAIIFSVLIWSNARRNEQPEPVLEVVVVLSLAVLWLMLWFIGGS